MTLEPGGQGLDFEYRDGQARVKVPQLDVHCVIMVE